MKKGPYKVLSSEVKYKNPWIEVKEEKVIRPDGKEGIFGIVEYGSGVTIVAMTKDREVYVLNEYLYALETYGLELPSGGVDEGETPLEAAKRELKEETGLVSEKWVDLGLSNPLTMIIKSPAQLFLALDVEQVSEPEENMEIRKVPFNEAVEMVLKSQITHAGSCNAILRAKFYLDRQ